MYYSKNGAGGIALPKNYSGSAFRVTDESDRTYHKEPPMPTQNDNISDREQAAEDGTRKCNEERGEGSVISSLLSGISVEDILLLGLIFVIHEENPSDPVLFLLLLLLLTK